MSVADHPADRASNEVIAISPHPLARHFPLQPHRVVVTIVTGSGAAPRISPRLSQTPELLFDIHEVTRTDLPRLNSRGPIEAGLDRVELGDVTAFRG